MNRTTRLLGTLKQYLKAKGITYKQLAVEMDAALPLKGRNSSGLLIGFRSWVFTNIADLHRRNTGEKEKDTPETLRASY